MNTNTQVLTENELWLLSFYRHSEIQGALFFARLAQLLPTGAVQCDITRHFADESQHARYWTDCITQLGNTPLKLSNAYQDKYFKAAGIPASLMEVLAITQVFEVRAIRQYGLHLKAPQLQPLVRETLTKIMEDEKWHLSWVQAALKDMEQKYGSEMINAAIKKYRQADQEVFEKTLKEYGEIIQEIVPSALNVTAAISFNEISN